MAQRTRRKLVAPAESNGEHADKAPVSRPAETEATTASAPPAQLSDAELKQQLMLLIGEKAELHATKAHISKQEIDIKLMTFLNKVEIRPK